MNPSEFAYQRAGSVDEAIALLEEHGEGAKLIAGGHSLLPIMKLRLAEPETLVDIGRIPELRGVRRADGEIRIGALTTHHQIATDEQIRSAVPLLSHTPMRPLTIRRQSSLSTRRSSLGEARVSGEFRHWNFFSIS